jgi:amino acid transporter
MTATRSRRSSPTDTSVVSRSLADGRLGVLAVMGFVLTAAAPATVVAGVVTTGYAVTGITGIPLAFLVVGAVLGLFSVGYVAMARHLPNAGAFYAYIAAGLGRPAGVGAAWAALLAYNGLQVGLYGGIGAVGAPLLEQWLGVPIAWWAVALAVWALVAVLGVLRVDLNGRVLALLLTAEIAVIVAFDIVGVTNPGDGHLSIAGLDPAELTRPGLGALLALALLGFVGFEGAAVYSEESKDPRRTVRVATYTAVAAIAGLYAASSWAMAQATGPDQVVATARAQGPETVFGTLDTHLGATIAELGRVLLLTSLIAAAISFHNTCARYAFALGRERVLPARFGRTGRRHAAPVTASLVQTVVGLAVIVGYAAAGADPLVDLFFVVGTTGGFGVLLLLTATSCAVVPFFARHTRGETLWRCLIAPIGASVALLTMTCLAATNYAILLGVPPGSTLAWALPAAYPVAALIGIAVAFALRATRPDIYAAIGLGAKAVTEPTAAPPAHAAPGRTNR